MSSNQKKQRVMVIYGGRSGEHEISLRSATSVLQNLDTEKFEIIPVAIDKQGKWLPNDIRLIENSSKALPAPQTLPVYKGIDKVDVVFPVMHGPLCEDGTVQGLL